MMRFFCCCCSKQNEEPESIIVNALQHKEEPTFTKTQPTSVMNGDITHKENLNKIPQEAMENKVQTEYVKDKIGLEVPKIMINPITRNGSPISARTWSPSMTSDSTSTGRSPSPSPCTTPTERSPNNSIISVVSGYPYLSVPYKREGVLGATEIELSKSARDSQVSRSVSQVARDSQVSKRFISSCGNVTNVKDIKLPKLEKSKKDRELIMKAVKSNEFLKSGLDSKQTIDLFVDAMQFKQIEANTNVLKEGEIGSHMYVSATGEFEVFKGDKKVNTLGPGKVFGELAILYNSKRNATIRSTKASTVWVLDRKVFHQIMMKSGMQRQDENVKFLRSVPILSELRESVLIQISDLLKVKFFPTNTVIIKQGDEGSLFYIVSGGKVSVTKMEDGEEKFINTLGVGQYFGEKSLLNNQKRLATVTADSPGVECLILDAVPFRQFLGDLEELKKPYTTPADIVEETLTSEYQYIQFQDLHSVATIGVGGFGRVDLVTYKKDANLSFALKRLKKAHIVEQHQQTHAYNEKQLMLSCRSDFICRLYNTYKDKKYLYFLMELCLGGDLWSALQKHKFFNEDTSRFMAGCVIEAFDYLHSRQIVYRDLKPENLLLDHRGYVKVVDFGFAKKLAKSSKTWTFAGTPEYVAPEIVLNKGHDRAADYWALGIFIHELLVGKPPFRGRDHMRTYNLILKGIDHIRFPRTMSKTSELIIKRLCRHNATDRLGYQKEGIAGIRSHSWFNNFDWEALKSGAMVAPIIPNIKSPSDPSNFEKYGSDTNIPPDDETGWDKDF